MVGIVKRLVGLCLEVRSEYLRIVASQLLQCFAHRGSSSRVAILRLPDRGFASPYVATTAVSSRNLTAAASQAGFFSALPLIDVARPPQIEFQV